MKRLPLLALLLFASGCGKPPPTTEVADKASSPPCGGAKLEGEVGTYKATANPTISGFDVGISNIFERDLADDAGVKKMRLSASLSIHDPETDAVRREIVVPDNVVSINADRYCVVGVDDGANDQPGSVSLQKLAL